MNRAVIELTARQLLGKRRTLLLFALCLLPVVIAILYRVSDRDDVMVQVARGVFVSDQPRWTANVILSRLVVATLLPLCALVFGTAALGSEFEDGTAVYLLGKPIARWKVVCSKLVVAWAATAALVVVSAVVAGTIAIQGAPPQGIVPGFAIAIIAGSFLYCALFVMLSIFTSRALIAGLIYVFFWEALLTSLFSGLRIFSVRQYTLGIAGSIADTTSRTFNAKLDGPEAVVLLLVASSAAVYFAVRRLKRWEIGEST
jgi:ABC-2 type transport system permease protein